MKRHGTTSDTAQHRSPAAWTNEARLQTTNAANKERPGGLQGFVDQSPRMLAQRRALQTAFGAVGKPAEQAPLSLRCQDSAPMQLRDESAGPLTHAKLSSGAGGERANSTGMPGQLKAGIEALSGMDISDVRVHRNSAKPAELNALAYAQGNDIHLGPGQEQHLPHEIWHVVQQRQGRVTETTKVAGVSVNDDASLESEADMMGGLALSESIPAAQRVAAPYASPMAAHGDMPAQRMLLPVLAVGGIGVTLWGAKKLYDWLFAEDAEGGEPTLASVIQDEAQTRGYGIRELELRLCSPEGVLLSLSSDRSAAATYVDLIGDGESKLTGSCGATSGMLKDALFQGAVTAADGEDNLYAALRHPGDTYLRVQIGCHSFIVEKRDGTCRVYQSYFGFDALADTIDLDQPMSTETFVAKLGQVIHQTNNSAQTELFHGQVTATSNRRENEEFRITCERPARTSNSEEVRQYIGAKLAEFQQRWDTVASTNLSVNELLEEWGSFEG